MAEAKAGGAVRKFVTRVMAVGVLLAVYCVGTAAVTGGLLTASVSPAEAQWRGRGWRGRGGRGRGWRGAVGAAGVEWYAAIAVGPAVAFASSGSKAIGRLNGGT